MNSIETLPLESENVVAEHSTVSFANVSVEGSLTMRESEPVASGVSVTSITATPSSLIVSVTESDSTPEQ